MSSRLSVKLFFATLVLGVLVASPVYRAAGQQAARATPPPAAATLRRAFNAGCAAELELVRAEMQRNDSEHTGGRYWLAHVRPKRTGSFQLKYKYRDNNPSYTHGERELPFTVGPKGCRRGPLGAAAYTYVCLGDTIILPIALDDYAGHTFNITRTPYQPELWESVATARPPEENNKLDRSPVANPAADYLQYVGRSVHQSSHRAGGYTLNFYAVFEARKPGRLNLALMGDSASFGLSGSVPILIIEPGTPLTLLPAREEVEQYDEGPPRFSSHYGGGYRTKLLILQPGDRISLPYNSIVKSRDEERADFQPAPALKEVVPIIRRLPFALDPAFGFNAWLIDYLPAAQPRQSR